MFTKLLFLISIKTRVWLGTSYSGQDLVKKHMIKKKWWETVIKKATCLEQMQMSMIIHLREVEAGGIGTKFWGHMETPSPGDQKEVDLTGTHDETCLTSSSNGHWDDIFRGWWFCSKTPSKLNKTCYVHNCQIGVGWWL